MKAALYPLAVLLLGLSLTSPLAAGKKAEQANVVVGKALKALKAHDVEALMKIAEVPWYHDKDKLIEDPVTLRQALHALFKEKDLSKVSLAVKDNLSYQKARGLFRESERVVLDKVFADEDRVVLLETSSGNRSQRVLLFVRLRGGQAKLAGFSD